MSTSQPITRRTVLKGMGTAVALPFLESLVPQAAFGSTPAKPPCRMAFVYVPNGVIPQDWKPREEGEHFTLPSILEPMAPFQQDMLVLSELTCDKARPNGDGAGDHARASAAFLTGAQPRKTAGANIEAGVSVDQYAAQRIGDRTRLPSLELAIERFRGTGNCDSGYSCVYEHTLSWRNATTPIPTEVDPREVFERLFAERPNDPDRLKRSRLRGSVLDTVREQAKSLDQKLGGVDRHKMDQYLTSVRELEKRIAIAEKLPPVTLPDGTEKPEGRPAELTEHFKMMCELMVLAFQTDVTRIASFMFAREGSEQRYRMLGIRAGHHSLTHHQGDRQKIEQISKINNFHIQQLAYLTEKLKSIPEGEGTLLDNCMIAYGSGNGDGNRHTHHDLPILLVGRGGGTIKPGRHIRYRRETPLNNLWLAMLERMGIHAKELGDSTGVLGDLA